MDQAAPEHQRFPWRRLLSEVRLREVAGARTVPKPRSGLSALQVQLVPIVVQEAASGERRGHPLAGELMAVALVFILAAINFLAAAAFALARNWPWALTYFGGFLILVGQLWAILREM